jgi:hypothetical protein
MRWLRPWRESYNQAQDMERTPLRIRYLIPILTSPPRPMASSYAYRMPAMHFAIQVDGPDERDSICTQVERVVRPHSGCGMPLGRIILTVACRNPHAVLTPGITRRPRRFEVDDKQRVGDRVHALVRHRRFLIGATFHNPLRL